MDIGIEDVRGLAENFAKCRLLSQQVAAKEPQKGHRDPTILIATHALVTAVQSRKETPPN